MRKTLPAILHDHEARLVRLEEQIKEQLDDMERRIWAVGFWTLVFAVSMFALLMIHACPLSETHKHPGPEAGVALGAGAVYRAGVESAERTLPQDPSANQTRAPSWVEMTAGRRRGECSPTVGRLQGEPCRRPRAAEAEGPQPQQRVDGPPGACAAPRRPRSDRPTDEAAGSEAGRGTPGQPLGLEAPLPDFAPSLPLRQGRGVDVVNRPTTARRTA